MPTKLVSITTESSSGGTGLGPSVQDIPTIVSFIFQTGLTQAFFNAFTPAFSRLAAPSPGISGGQPTAMTVTENFTVAAMGNTTTPLALYALGVQGSQFRMPTPSSVPAMTPLRMAFSPSNRVLVTQGLAGDNSVAAYQLDATGYNVRLPSPTVGVGQGTAVAFNSTGTLIAVGGSVAPFIAVYDWSDDYGFGSKYPDPVTPITSAPQNIIFGPGDRTIVLGNATENFVAYQWTGAGFGSMYPSSGVLGTGSALGFTKSGRTILVGSNTAPRAVALPWDDVTGFGVAYPAPSVPGNAFNSGSKTEYSRHRDYDLFLFASSFLSQILVGFVDDVGWGRVMTLPGSQGTGARAKWAYIEQNTGGLVGGHVEQKGRKKKRKLDDVNLVTDVGATAPVQARPRIKVPKLLETLMVRLEKSTEIAQKQRASRKSAEELMLFF